MRATIKKGGAGCIIPLGGAVVPTLVSPKDLEREVGVPVLNTKAIGIRFAEMCVQLGMTQSALNYPLAQLRYEDFTAFKIKSPSSKTEVVQKFHRFPSSKFRLVVTLEI